MSKQRPGVSGDPMRRYHPRTPKIETARHLMNVCRRYLDDKAGDHDIRSAFRMWSDECSKQTIAEGDAAFREEEEEPAS